MHTPEQRPAKPKVSTTKADQYLSEIEGANFKSGLFTTKRGRQAKVNALAQRVKTAYESGQLTEHQAQTLLSKLGQKAQENGLSSRNLGLKDVSVYN